MTKNDDVGQPSLTHLAAAAGSAADPLDRLDALRALTDAVAEQNAVGHGTVNAQGTVTAGSALINPGSPVSFHNNAQARWAVGADQNGPTTFAFNKVGC
jgi:L-serine deaminase